MSRYGDDGMSPADKELMAELEAMIAAEGGTETVAVDPGRQTPDPMDDPELQALEAQVDAQIAAESASRIDFSVEDVVGVIGDLTRSRIKGSNGFFASKNVAKKLGFADTKSFGVVTVEHDHRQSDIADVYNALLGLKDTFVALKDHPSFADCQDALDGAYQNLKLAIQGVDKSKIEFIDCEMPSIDISLAAEALKDYIKSDRFQLSEGVAKPSTGASAPQSFTLGGGRNIGPDINL